jgi:tetratricopeptide (TPR) repeat protein
MSDALNLFDELLSRARRLQEAGRWREALRLLYRLAGFEELPSGLGEEVHARIGEIFLKRRRYAQARKFLREALRRRPGRARSHFLLGLAFHADPHGDKGRALRHYRRSLELAPDQARCRGEAGLLSIDMGRVDEGLALLRQAAEKAPADAGAVGRLVKGLCLAGRPDEARAAVRSALFAAPRCRRLNELRIDLELAELRRSRDLASARRDREEGPVLLPFIRLADTHPSPRAPHVRRDGAGALAGPHLVRIRARAERRRAP